MTSMDLGEDFEIRPLTKGLGFHKKSVNLSEEIRKTDLYRDPLTTQLPSMPPAALFDETELESSHNHKINEARDLRKAEEAKQTSSSSKSEIDELIAALDRVSRDIGAEVVDSRSLEEYGVSRKRDEVRITETLPRRGVEMKGLDVEMEPAPKEEIAVSGTSQRELSPAVPRVPTRNEISVPMPSNKPAPPSVPDSIGPQDSIKPSVVVKGELSEKTFVEEAVAPQRNAHDSPLRLLEPVYGSLAASLLDVMVVLAIALLFLMGMLFATGMGLDSVFAGLSGDRMTQISFAIMYVALYQMYAVVVRSFCGRTLGEWTFDYQLGDQKQMQRASYALLVFLRSFFITATGIFLIPLLSFLFRKDLLSYLVGLQMYRRK